ncbi:phage BR0599 family protein [Methylovulum miyakonense]|uniref:phage BR0599 family protein n=1 Tax=Methylovulum miyakonense TaxID=645578 RepID=UPI0003749B8C|nr:phage BR0599 family protein [Methylovulum miyakonense]
MTFNALEVSSYDSEPYHLYEFSNGFMTWRYTSSEYLVNQFSEVFVPEQISHTEIGGTTELNKQVLKVTVPRSNDIAQMFQFYPPTGVVLLTIWECHHGDSEVVVVWIGRVRTTEYMGAHVEIQCEPISTSMRRLGLRRIFQRQCPHILYGQDEGGCLVDPEAFKVIATVSSVSGLVIAVSGMLTANSFNGGMMSWTSSIGLQYRFITSNDATTLSVNFPFMPPGDTYGRDLEVGTSINLYPGCNHTLTDCIEKFNNLDNYGGQPFMPLDNPFNGATLY